MNTSYLSSKLFPNDEASYPNLQILLLIHYDTKLPIQTANSIKFLFHNFLPVQRRYQHIFQWSEQNMIPYSSPKQLLQDFLFQPLAHPNPPWTHTQLPSNQMNIITLLLLLTAAYSFSWRTTAVFIIYNITLQKDIGLDYNFLPSCVLKYDTFFGSTFSAIYNNLFPLGESKNELNVTA